MLIPSEYNFEIWQGADFTWQFTLSFNDVPFPALVDSVKMQIRDENFDLLATLSTDPEEGEGEIMVTEETTYTVYSFLLPAALTALIPDQINAQYDVAITSGLSVEKPYYGRKIVIQKGVTL
jgi:hypothetical protein